MSSSPPLEDPDYAPAAGRGWRGLSRLRRELIIFGVELLCGLVLIPLAVWVAGNRVLGGYTHGQNQHAGALALLGDFFTGLAHGSTVFWGVALGPAILVTLLRAFIHLLRFGFTPEV
jgi:hypothetical protein